MDDPNKYFTKYFNKSIIEQEGSVEASDVFEIRVNDNTEES